MAPQIARISGPEEDRRDPQTYLIIGAAMEVHKRLGPGFLEVVYQEALAIELGYREVPFRREVNIPLSYREQTLNCSFRVDFLCFDEIIVELKAVSRLSNVEEAQVMNYLKATDYRRALLINFGEMSLRHRRYVHNYS